MNALPRQMRDLFREPVANRIGDASQRRAGWSGLPATGRIAGVFLLKTVVRAISVLAAGGFTNQPTEVRFIVHAPLTPTPQVLAPRVPSPIFRNSCRPPTYEGKPITV
jgi:hypothetical protein